MPVAEAKLPIDTSVPIPASVLRASEAANAAHAAAYKTDPAAPIPPAAIVPDPALTAPKDPIVPPIVPVQEPPKDPTLPAPVDPPPATPPALPPDDSNVSAEQWHHRFLSMKGRFEQSQLTLGQMQEQMSQLGDELQRVNQTLIQRQAAPPPPPPPVQRHVTDADVQTYGPELIDLARRIALDAVAPDLQNLNSRTQQVSQRLAQQGTADLYATLDAQVPTWKEVNKNPRFKAWCHLPDVYSGQVRGQLLSAAFKAANAPRVVAFFNGFLTEEQATGNAPAPRPQPGDTPPRTAAVSLDTLAAPGRAKPATGDTAIASADKPVFTRAQVADFYANVRKGVYTGRDADKARDEASIFAAQREGRVR